MNTPILFLFVNLILNIIYINSISINEYIIYSMHSMYYGNDTTILYIYSLTKKKYT
jgi:hypothetical protein